MNARLAKLLLTAAVLLLGGSLVLLSRFDAQALRSQAMAQLTDSLQAKVAIGCADFSLLHGMTLRLHDVAIDAADWQCRTRELHLDLALLPLFFGEERIDSIFLLEPQFTLHSGKGLAGMPAIPPTLHLPRLNIRRGILIGPQGRHLLDDLLLDVRNLAAEGEMQWELRAHIDERKLSAQGKTKLKQGRIAASFGKLKFDHLPVARLLADALPAAWQAGRASGALTFDSLTGERMDAFGELRLYPDGESGEIVLRGKLVQRQQSGWHWQDGFIHLARNSVLATSGGCDNAGRCRATLTTRGADLAALTAALQLPPLLRGRLDLDADWKLDANGWQLSANSGLRRLSVATGNGWRALPDQQFDLKRLQRGSDGRWHLESANLHLLRLAGGIELRQLPHRGEGWRLAARLDLPDRFWLPLSEMLLHRLGAGGTFGGHGPLRGDLILTEAGRQQQLAFDLDLDAAGILIPDHFNKGAGVPLRLRGDYSHEHAGQTLRLAASRIAASRLDRFVWQQAEATERMALRGRIDLDDLHAIWPVAIRFLPTPDGTEHGLIEADIANRSLQARTTIADWFGDLDGQVLCRNFGFGSHHFDGAITLQAGVASASQLHWHGKQGYALLTGRLDLARREGVVDIGNGLLDWPQGSRLPAWLPDLKLSGRMQIESMQWHGQSLEQLRANYRWQERHLLLSPLSLHLAGGTLTSAHLQTTLLPDRIAFSGPLALRAIDLHALQPLSTLLSAQLYGRLSADLLMQGALPPTPDLPLRGNGRLTLDAGAVELHRGFDRLWLTPAGRASVQRFPFRRLRAELLASGKSIRLRQLAIDNASGSWQGEVGWQSDGSTQLRLHPASRADDAIVIEGNWPALRWQRQTAEK